mgnify:CR=1 FL=1
MQPKMCNKCKKNIAVVFITKIENGVTLNEGYCLKCARGLGLPQIDQAVKQMGISEDELDRNWQRLILTHLLEKTHIGVLTGSPITDMKITLIAGRAHIKHTEGGDFRQATYRAVRQGLMQAESILLEPYYDFELTPVIEENLKYITAADNYESIKDAFNNNAPGVSYVESNDGSTTMNYIQNPTSAPASVSASSSKSTTTSVSSSFSESENHSFSESIKISAGVKLQEIFNVGVVNTVFVTPLLIVALNFLPVINIFDASSQMA